MRLPQIAQFQVNVRQVRGILGNPIRIFACFKKGKRPLGWLACRGKLFELDVNAGQIAMQQRFERFNLYYERKVRQFDKIAGVDASRIAPNEIVAQSYLAVVLKKPSDARRRKYRVWGDLYDKIFSGDTAIEPYVISFQLHRLAALWLRASGNTAETDDLTRRLAKNGVFHIARIAAFNWRGGDDWVVKEGDFAEQITSLEKKPKEMDAYFKAALDTFPDGFGYASQPASHPGPSRTLSTSPHPLLVQHSTSERSNCPAVD